MKKLRIQYNLIKIKVSQYVTDFGGIYKTFEGKKRKKEKSRIRVEDKAAQLDLHRNVLESHCKFETQLHGPV